MQRGGPVRAAQRPLLRRRDARLRQRRGVGEVGQHLRKQRHQQQLRRRFRQRSRLDVHDHQPKGLQGDGDARHQVPDRHRLAAPAVPVPDDGDHLQLGQQCGRPGVDLDSGALPGHLLHLGRRADRPGHHGRGHPRAVRPGRVPGRSSSRSRQRLLPGQARRDPDHQRHRQGRRRHDLRQRRRQRQLRPGQRRGCRLLLHRRHGPLGHRQAGARPFDLQLRPGLLPADRLRRPQDRARLHSELRLRRGRAHLPRSAQGHLLHLGRRERRRGRQVRALRHAGRAHHGAQRRLSAGDDARLLAERHGQRLDLERL